MASKKRKKKRTRKQQAATRRMLAARRKSLAKKQRGKYVQGRASSPALNKRLRKGKHGTLLLIILKKKPDLNRPVHQTVDDIEGFRTHYPHESKRRK